jgi:acyl carrier protein
MSIEARVIRVIRENSEDIDALPTDADLRDELGIDSFGTMMIVNGIEDDFSVTIDEADIPSIRTVADIVHLLRDKYGISEEDTPET